MRDTDLKYNLNYGAVPTRNPLTLFECEFSVHISDGYFSFFPSCLQTNSKGKKVVCTHTALAVTY